MAALLATPAAAGVFYVKATASGAGTGANWSDAFTDLQAGIAAAQPGDQVWVAEGTYKPAGPGGSRTVSFQLKDGVTIFGGFPGLVGQEGNLAVRNPTAHPCVLSGDLNGDDGPGFANTSENSIHVVVFYGPEDATPVLDGFTITGGRADQTGTTEGESGGGLYIDGGSPTISNCIFSANWAYHGGGLGIQASEEFVHPQVQVSFCAFESNYATQAGGGVWGSDAITDDTVTLVFQSCRFKANAAGVSGGAVSMGDGCLEASSCIFSGNRAKTGGAVYSLDAWGHIAYCDLLGNYASDHGGSAVISTSDWIGFSLSNSIIRENRPDQGSWWSSLVDLGYCDLEGGPTDGTDHNIDADPLFVLAGHWDDEGTPGDASDDVWVDGDYHLTAESPCLNAGGHVNEVEPDIDGDARPIGPRTDIGADEFQGQFAVLTVNVEGGPYNGGVTVDPAKEWYWAGTTVTLTATPMGCHRFDHWEGDLTGDSNPATLTLDAEDEEDATDKTVIAVFVCLYDLQVDVVGEGTVEPRSGTFEPGERVYLDAQPAPCWELDHWEGDCCVDGSSSLYSVEMDDYKSLTAVFTHLPLYALTVTIEGSGAVDPPGGSFCEGDVSLTASPQHGWGFAYWEDGHTTSFTPQLDIRLEADRTVHAIFEAAGAIPRVLYLQPHGRMMPSPPEVTGSVSALVVEPSDQQWAFMLGGDLQDTSCTVVLWLANQSDFWPFDARVTLGLVTPDGQSSDLASRDVTLAPNAASGPHDVLVL